MSSLIEQIKSRLKLEDVLVQLGYVIKNGSVHCPNHVEKTGSCHVYGADQRLHCFGCGWRGDVLDLIALHTKRSLSSVIQYYVETFGLSQNAETRKRQLRALNHAAIIFARTHVEDVTQYWWERGVSKEWIKAQQLGYCDGSELVQLKQFHDEKTLREVGLLSERGGSPLYKRWIIPIRDPEGRVIAFAGRIADGGDGAKYLNTTNSEVFRKSATLYGLQAGDTDVVVVEGYADVLTLRSHNIPALALMGTAFGAEHTHLLRGRKITLCLDGDRAGQKASLTSVQTMFEHGLNDVSLMMLPQGVDPDELILTNQWEAHWNKRMGIVPYLLSIAPAIPQDAFFTQVKPITKHLDVAGRDRLTRELGLHWHIDPAHVADGIGGRSIAAVATPDPVLWNVDELAFLRGLLEDDWTHSLWAREMRTHKLSLLSEAEFSSPKTGVIYTALRDATNQFQVETRDFVLERCDNVVSLNILTVPASSDLYKSALKIRLRHLCRIGNMSEAVKIKELLRE